MDINRPADISRPTSKTSTTMAALSDTPWIQVLMPVAFLAFAAVVAVPPFALHILLHPFQYVFTTASLSERISTLQSKFFYFAWRVMSPVLDPGDKPNKAPLLAKARGTVLEIGPGVGDNIKYYNRSLVHRLILVEPNTNMHAALREKANQSGYFDQDGSLLLLGCGGAASDEKALALAGVGPDSIDSLMAIHVLCGIPQPAEAVEMYRRILKTGGLLTFYEHVRSDQRFTANWSVYLSNTKPSQNELY